MRSVVVYESMYGNTHTVAEAAKHGKPPPQMDPHWQDPGLRDWFKTCRIHRALLPPHLAPALMPARS
ncbi:MAG: hypothetical protein WCP28_01740 [Actinomycetes bacterium]